jgi:hypothetical protein
MRNFVILAAVGYFASAAAVSAQPTRLTASQLDKVVAGAQQTSDGFVCPVIKTDAVLNSPKGGALPSGEYTIGGPDVTVPTLATNADGSGDPAGAHASPGDTNYSPVWPNR